MGSTDRVRLLANGLRHRRRVCQADGLRHGDVIHPYPRVGDALLEGVAAEGERGLVHLLARRHLLRLRRGRVVQSRRSTSPSAIFGRAKALEIARRGDAVGKGLPVVDALEEAVALGDGALDAEHRREVLALWVRHREAQPL